MADVVVLAAIMMLAVSAAVFQLIYQLPRHWDGRLREIEADVWMFLPYSDEFKSGMKRGMPVRMLVSPFLFSVPLPDW